MPCVSKCISITTCILYIGVELCFLYIITPLMILPVLYHGLSTGVGILVLLAYAVAIPLEFYLLFWRRRASKSCKYLIAAVFLAMKLIVFSFILLAAYVTAQSDSKFMDDVQEKYRCCGALGAEDEFTRWRNEAILDKCRENASDCRELLTNHSGALGAEDEFPLSGNKSIPGSCKGSAGGCWHALTYYFLVMIIMRIIYDILAYGIIIIGLSRSETGATTEYAEVERVCETQSRVRMINQFRNPFQMSEMRFQNSDFRNLHSQSFQKVQADTIHF